jgi:AraC-like DNA-binding protein
MSPATAHLPLALDRPVRTTRPRVWRPFPRELADLVVVEDGGREVQPRMHPWFGICLVRSGALVTVEARREVVAQRNWIMLIPAFQLYGLRAQGDAAPGAVTLLLGGSLLEGLDLPTQAALVTDAALGGKVADQIAQLQRPVQAVEQATRIRSLLEQLLPCSTPLAAGRARHISPLAPVRTLLRDQVSESVPTQDLARLSGVSEWHLIRSFHYEFGLPPHAYHLRLRLAFACELLARGLPVASVAYECGFADQSHLNRKFKAVYGLTPAAWAGRAPGRNCHDAPSTGWC